MMLLSQTSSSCSLLESKVWLHPCHPFSKWQVSTVLSFTSPTRSLSMTESFAHSLPLTRFLPCTQIHPNSLTKVGSLLAPTPVTHNMPTRLPVPVPLLHPIASSSISSTPPFFSLAFHRLERQQKTPSTHCSKPTTDALLHVSCRTAFAAYPAAHALPWTAGLGAVGAG